MLAVPPLRATSKDEKDEGKIESFPIDIDFADLNCGNILDSIDFDIFIGMEDGDILPDLELDSDMLADFSVSSGEGGSGGEELSDTNKSALVERVEEAPRKEEEEKVSNREEEIVRKRHGSTAQNPSSKGRKSSAQSKNSQGRRKVKVDWTPELHRRFVQAVEQLGADKAVPSRILELMGIDCLTRHNIASHLQKYRSHRKHLLAREAEAASWSQRRQIYGSAAPGGGGGKRGSSMSHWAAPTMGFPPMAPLHPFRPLHVWGHPTVDQSQMHMWPNKHLSPPPPPNPTWPQPPPGPSYWHPHPHRVSRGLIPPPVTPCFPQQLPPTGYGRAPPFAGIPTTPTPTATHHAVYRSLLLDPMLSTVPPPPQTGPAPAHHLDFHPSKESVDAAIEDALSKPWVPLPLGLKPPSMDSVVVELQRQGIPKIPPACHPHPLS